MIDFLVIILNIIGLIFLTIEFKFISKKTRNIVGVLIITISSILNFTLNSTNSKKYEKQLDRIEKGLISIQSTSTNIPQSETNYEIDSIQNEYLDLIKKFDKKRAIVIQEKLENNINQKKERIELSKKYRPIYINYFDFIRNYINAYNRTYNSKIQISEKAEIPYDIFDEKIDEYEFIIKFDSSTYLRLNTSGTEFKINRFHLPTIYIEYLKDKDLNNDLNHNSDYVMIRNSLNNSFISITYGNYFSNIPDKQYENIEQFEKEGKEIIKNILDYELAKHIK